MRRKPVEPQVAIEGEGFDPPPAIMEIQEAATCYAQYRDERIEVGRQEKNLKTQLTALMEQHGLTEYKRGGITITFEVEKKLKVRVDGASEVSGEGEEEPEEGDDE